MNFALSEEQEFLREAARGTLGRVSTVEAAREALDGDELPDLWPAAVEAGWPGLLVSEERGGAGLGAIEAMLVFAELGRVLAAVPLLGPPARDVAARRRPPGTASTRSRPASGAPRSCRRSRRRRTSRSGPPTRATGSSARPRPCWTAGR